MAVSKTQMEAILGRAKQLCSPNGERLIESYSGRNMQSDPYNPDPNDFADFDDSIYLNEESTVDSINAYNEITASRSNIPDAIKKSMLTERIDTDKLGGFSVIDDNMINNITKSPNNRQQNTKKTQQRSINEVHTATQVGGIDYTIIKAIVNECIENKFSQYFKNNTLNESKISSIKLSEGKIRLVDNKGKVFEANLEYKGTLKNKQ